MKQLECSVGTGGERALAAVIFLGEEKIGWAGRERGRWVDGVEIRSADFCGGVDRGTAVLLQEVSHRLRHFIQCHYATVMKQLECSVGTGGERALAAVIFLGEEKIGWAGRERGRWVDGVEIRSWDPCVEWR
jgi:hypothetical protein